MQTFSFIFIFINLLLHLYILQKKTPLFSFVIFLFIHSFNVLPLDRPLENSEIACEEKEGVLKPLFSEPNLKHTQGRY